MEASISPWPRPKNILNVYSIFKTCSVFNHHQYSSERYSTLFTSSAYVILIEPTKCNKWEVLYTTPYGWRFIIQGIKNIKATGLRSTLQLAFAEKRASLKAAKWQLQSVTALYKLQRSEWNKKNHCFRLCFGKLPLSFALTFCQA